MLKIIRTGINIYTTYKAYNAIKSSLIGNKKTSIFKNVKKISKLLK